MEQLRKKLPVGIQSFETMRTENYLYVDKTEHIYQMVTSDKFYFLSRPRRFGKSLLVSTLNCLFQGRKELFEGLWIAEQTEWEWQPHPVIFLDFNEIPGNSPDALREGLAFRLHEIADEFEVTIKAPGVELLFQQLITTLYKKTGRQVVILIDEYDKRIIEHLGKGQEHLETAKEIRDVLKPFFGILKGQSIANKLRLIFITGVSRFSKVSLFSDLNNLRDLSMLGVYADLLGYTQQELEACFSAYLTQLAQKLTISVSELLEILARKYNGYRFSDRQIRMYNPFSVLNALNDQELGDYWFASATPTFLVNLLHEKRYNLLHVEEKEVSQTIFTSFDLDNLRPEALLFQTGYLTIADVQNQVYTLAYPNQEVKHAFSEALLFGLVAEGSSAISSHVLKLPLYLRQEDYQAFFETMRSIFASIPYDIESKRDEAYFHTIFYLAMSASGMVEVRSSVLTSDGRIDLVVQFPEKLFIIEFKCNQSADDALQQIRDKGYAEKYRGSGTPMVLIGINFNQKKRNLEEWKVVPE